MLNEQTSKRDTKEQLCSNFKNLFPSSFQDMTHYKPYREAKGNKQTEKLKRKI